MWLSLRRMSRRGLWRGREDMWNEIGNELRMDSKVKKIVRKCVSILLLMIAMLGFAVVIYFLTFVGQYYDNHRPTSLELGNAVSDYYDDIGFHYFILDCVILGVSLIFLMRLGVIHILYPKWRPKWLKPISKNNIRVMLLIFATAFLTFRLLADRQVKEIAT